MNRDAALPHILAEQFLQWWREMGRPDLVPAFHDWADQHHLRPRRCQSVWRRVGEMRGVGEAA